MEGYNNRCGNCEYFDWVSEYKKGYCSYYKTYYYPTDDCIHYKEKGMPSTCYLTTIVCTVLGRRDDDRVLNDLRVFRDSVLQKDGKYRKILYEYDTVGPQLAQSIANDFLETGDKSLAINLFENYIKPTSILASRGKVEKAVSKYSQMTNLLKKHYGIYASPIYSYGYDYRKGGHGKVLTRKS